MCVHACLYVRVFMVVQWNVASRIVVLYFFYFIVLYHAAVTLSFVSLLSNSSVETVSTSSRPCRNSNATTSSRATSLPTLQGVHLELNYIRRVFTVNYINLESSFCSHILFNVLL